MQQQKLAVETGHWPLYRFDPRLSAEGAHPLQLDSKEPTKPLAEYLYNEGRYRQLVQADPETAAQLLGRAQETVKARRKIYLQMAEQG
jgi:pyruvate-ferredoxin/flavodoxin oxidoreductase